MATPPGAAHLSPKVKDGSNRRLSAALPDFPLPVDWLGAPVLGGRGGTIPDAHPIDVFEVSLDLPPGCPPSVGNEKGVGRPCTRGGNECGNGANDLHCTCDMLLGIRLDGVPCLCTLVRVNNSVDAGDPCTNLPSNYCGTNTRCCSYMSAGAYCVPNICLSGQGCPAVTP